MKKLNFIQYLLVVLVVKHVSYWMMIQSKSIFFSAGFSHRHHPTSIDLNAVRLCFQVFLEGDKKGKFTVPLPPVVSEPILDKKATADLVIVKMSDCNSHVDGGRKDIILLCEKVSLVYKLNEFF